MARSPHSAPQPLRGRPTRAESEAIERRLREAAVEAFVTNGFDGTTMEAVAAAAGVTKRTLYAKYPDKEALFAAVIPRALADMPFRGEAFEIPESDVGTALGALARQIVARVVDPEAVKLRRFAMIEAHRLAAHRRVGGELWAASLRSVIDLLATHAGRGEIVVKDLEATADLFVALVAGYPTSLADFGVIQSPKEQARHVDRAVKLFLTGVLPRP